jgi:hypothetical protein
MKPVFALLGVGFVILMLGAVMLALGTFRGAEFTEPHNVTTAGGATTTAIVLANEVLDNSTTNIEVLSDDSDDAPVPYLYTENNHTLTINGLAESTTRTLTITYNVPRLDDFTDIASRYLPSFMIIGGIAIVIGSAISAFKGR